MKFDLSRNQCNVSNDRNQTIELLANFKLADDIEVPWRINSFEIIQQFPSATDHREQTAPTGEVLFVRTHMLSQSIDPRRQNGDLDFWRSRIGITAFMFLNQA